MRYRTRYSILTIGSGIGLAAASLEMLEYMALLKNPNAALACNLNGVFSCTNVLNSWQSSVFGFPNILMCLIFFTLLFSAGLIGLSGGTITRGFRLAVHGIALFFLARVSHFQLRSRAASASWMAGLTTSQSCWYSVVWSMSLLWCFRIQVSNESPMWLR